MLPDWEHLPVLSLLPFLLLATKITASSSGVRLKWGDHAKRKASSEYRGSDQELSQPARPVAGRHRAPHRPAALLPFARGKRPHRAVARDRKSTRLNSSHPSISYAVFCLKKKKADSTAHHRYGYTM